ncbi:hypothetical protein A6768_08890 [Sphingobium yanoikuyae]|uniref:Uncharacterized protein n=1 Tax=Sphingobium yanoikuyae TaxID=13690 RepID=A0A291MYM5_SPHYA|nr:hypothetical protein A6768_08890 [Sphingobium yanoikuyae]
MGLRVCFRKTGSGPLPRPTTRQDDTGSGGWAGERAGTGSNSKKGADRETGALRYSVAGAQRSMHIDTPMPPPTHRVARPFFASRFAIS